MNEIFGVIEDLTLYKSNGDKYKGQDASIPAKINLGQDAVIDTKVGKLQLKNIFNVECKSGKLLIESDNCFVIFLPNKLN